MEDEFAAGASQSVEIVERIDLRPAEYIGEGDDDEDLSLLFEERAKDSLMKIGKEHKGKVIRWNDPQWTYWDVAMIQVQGGNGGPGCKSFMRQKNMPRMGPDGGNGGHGGHVYLKAVSDKTSLASLKQAVHWKARPGVAGRGKHLDGKNGCHREIPVPPGCCVYVRDAWLNGKAQGHQNGENQLMTWEDVGERHFVGELTKPGQMLRVARGGRGGRGNASYKSHSNTAPWIYENGEKGLGRWIEIELKMVADVGIIGVPNAGKSSLLSVTTNQMPKVAAYPFSTTVPNVGFYKADEHGGITLVDVPGLVEGAHEGRGMGHQFLRHIERCRTLIHVVSGASENPVRDYEAIQHELREYSTELAMKPQVIVVNKTDIPEVQEYLPELMAALRKRAGHSRVFDVSAATQNNVKELMRRVFKWHKSVTKHDRPEADDKFGDRELIVGNIPLMNFGEGIQEVSRREPVPLDKERPRGRARLEAVEPRVEWDVLESAWRMLHPEIERMAKQISWKWGDEHKRFNEVCKNVGMTQVLARKVKDGEVCIVGDHKFTYEPGMVGQESRMLIYEINLNY